MVYDRTGQLNEAHTFLDSVIAVLHEPMIVLNKNFIIEKANDAFFHLFNLNEDQTLGKVLFELQDNTWAITDLLKALNNVREEKQRIADVEIEHTFPGIGTRNILFNVQMVKKDESDSLILLALNDITETKNVERMHLLAKNMEQNAEMLNSLFINSPAFIATFKGPEFVFDIVNPAYEKLCGNRPLQGKPLMEAIPELRGQGMLQIMKNVYNTGEIFVGKEMPLWISYGEGKAPAERYFNFSYQPIYDEEKITGILEFGYEITDEALAKKKAEKNLRLILQTIPQITFTASSDGKILFFNKYALDYSGLTIGEATNGKGWEKIVHPEDIEGVIALAKACLATKEDFFKEVRLKRARDGKYRWHLMRATSIKDSDGDGTTAWVGMAIDIQEQKVNEQKKDEFLNIASHEMKTPLAAIKGYLQLLEFSLDEATEPALFVQKALGAANRLNNLVNELLEVGKTQNGKLNYKMAVFDFNKMVKETIEDQQHTAPEYTIIQKGNATSKIKGDHDRLQQVVINLISNAIKYSPDKKKIVATTKEEGGDLVFSVKDNGIGISKENLQHIFNRYFRVEDQAMRFQGMGIGLYISNEIIKRHHGKMWIESEIGKGSTFYFSIPLNNREI